MIEENIRRKIEELVLRASPPLTYSSTRLPGAPRDTQHWAECEGWLAEALNMVEMALPKPGHPYRRRLVDVLERDGGSLVSRILSAAQIMRGLLADIDAGLLGDLGNKVRAETFDNFLDHAQAYLDENRAREAGVIAGVAFEDTVRRMCRDQEIKEKGVPLEDLINALAKKDVITGQQSKQAKVASHVRTKATHARWDEFDRDGVADAIGITRLFLREHLGG